MLGAAAITQTLIFVLSGSVALLADLIHNFGDALTAGPPSESPSSCAQKQPPTHLFVLAAAGVIGYAGNWIAA